MARRTTAYRGVADVHQFEQFRADLLNISEEGYKEIENKLAVLCKPILVDATAKAKEGPTKKLKKSIRLKIAKNKQQKNVAVRISTQRIRYGMAVEVGTYKDKKQPFIRPAFDKHVFKIADEITGDIIEVVRKYIENE